MWVLLDAVVSPGFFSQADSAKCHPLSIIAMYSLEVTCEINIVLSKNTGGDCRNAQVGARQEAALTTR